LNSTSPHILLVNPWIHDFAAYDFWAKPLGLLLVAAHLRRHGLHVSYIDCLDRFHPQSGSRNPAARHGRGPYLKTEISKPAGLSHVPRRFSRYGIPPEWFQADLAALSRPDLIMVTSLMTYWYPGVQETIAAIRAVFPDSPVILGGIYATLCHDHAVSFSGADDVFTGSDLSRLPEIIAGHTGYSFDWETDPNRPDTWPKPAFDLQHKIGYIPILTTIGCPFDCTYCAVHHLHPGFSRRPPAAVVAEIEFWHHRHDVDDFVFYDDALLVDFDNHARLIFEKVLQARLNVRFHLPNAVHIREISEDSARLMRRAGITTVRLGLETADFAHREQLDRKVNETEYHHAVTGLKQAGFSKKQLGAYLLAGLPGQSIESVERAIRVVRQSGITPILAHYTPIPHTAMWEAARAASPYDIAADPVFTNNAIFPCRREGFSWETYSRLKQLVIS